MRLPRIFCVVVLVSLMPGLAMASWYDDYDAGLTAARKGSWSVVVQKMSAAISAHDKESDKERTYGTIFINYHPHYYRGVAYLNLGKYDQAVSDLEKATGPGPEDLGSIDTLMQRAKTKLEAASAPAPAPEPTPQPTKPAAQIPVPTPVPAAPTIDPALRQQVNAAISEASTHLASARGRNATASQEYKQATQLLADANGKVTTAKSNEDLNAALASARNSVLFADSAVPPGATPKPPVTASIAPTRPTAAADLALSDYRAALRNALVDYFNGEFDSASRGFESLTKAMPTNGWIWAFLGASRYSQYAFEADDTYKASAIEAFRHAKSSPHFKTGLPEKYFSKRIRRFFNTLG